MTRGRVRPCRESGKTTLAMSGRVTEIDLRRDRPRAVTRGAAFTREPRHRGPRRRRRRAIGAAGGDREAERPTGTTIRMRTGLVAEAVDAVGATSPVGAETPVETRAAEALMGTGRREMPTPFWPFSAR